MSLGILYLTDGIQMVITLKGALTLNYSLSAMRVAWGLAPSDNAYALLCFQSALWTGTGWRNGTKESLSGHRSQFLSHENMLITTIGSLGGE